MQTRSAFIPFYATTTTTTTTTTLTHYPQQHPAQQQQTQQNQPDDPRGGPLQDLSQHDVQRRRWSLRPLSTGLFKTPLSARRGTCSQHPTPTPLHFSGLRLIPLPFTLAYLQQHFVS
ncbi:hypothetical protein K457DRAFT_314654 [Linnemannia elongata AG-77]|uniref:Uncharacterized protein n=1 Tax=Linnemannia elongata AG-77 TaxID=1314771 RepID=A0A197JDA3_9FUNG|nr:hypothetical protein K457DRAFT_314654 [Linnemannia elongata AG-77]